MCILCVVQKWSRRIATMLPWLVIPLIGLWALSQLLPPALRFEVTSPRLACVLVLLVTLFLYEILMPQLSAWRARRSARLREKKRFEAIEMQKLRKTATRRCRNCLTAYREQNPGGGRFMCSFCGHVSRRPVLDIPGGVLGCKNMEGIGASGIMGDLVGKGGKIWNGKVWTERQGWSGSGNGWFCGDWSENVNWAGGTFPGRSNDWGKNGGVFGSAYLDGDNRCLAEKSYSGVAVFGSRLLGVSLVSIRWLWRRVFRIGSSGEDASSDSDSRANLRKGEGGLGFQESKGEKARRKAEEKRQARLEREMLEEEERKQREEVARLVEERRRLRDEKTDAEKGHVKGPGLEKDRDSKREKESEKKRHEKTKDRDRFSSTDKSNSEGEEVDRRSSRENEKKREFDGKVDSERKDSSKHSVNQAIEVKSPESFRVHGSDTGHGGKGSNNASKAGPSRYFDRMRGSFLSSSKALGGSALTPFFGRGVQAGTQTPAKVIRSGSGDHVHTHSADTPAQHLKPTSTFVWDGMLPSGLRAEVIDGSSETSPKRVPAYINTSDMHMHLNEYKAGRPSSGNGDSKSFSITSQSTVHMEPQSGGQLSAPKKSWQHLFSRTKSTCMPVTTKPDSQVNPKRGQVEFGASHLPELASPTNSLHNQHSPGFSTPPTIPSIPSSSGGGCSMPRHTFEPGSFTLVDPLHDHIVDKGESFDDTAYIADPVFLLGPVSESLDNFSLDIGSGFLPDVALEKTRTLKKVSTSAEVVRPSPIESPVSKLFPQGCVDEVNSSSGQLPCSLKSSDSNGNTDEQGTWHMWDTPPIVQDGLGLIGSPSWLLPTLNNNPAGQNMLHPLLSSSVFSQTRFKTEDQLVPCLHSPLSFCSSYGPKCGAFDSLDPGLNGEDPWQQKSIFQPLPEGDGHFSQHKQESSLNKEVSYDTATRQTGGQAFEPSPGGWSRNNWVVHPTGNGAANAPPLRPHRKPFSNSDVQSLWSYK